jgi:hypothetical protein
MRFRLSGRVSLVCSALVLAAVARPAVAQQAANTQATDPADTGNNKRIFWIIPNFRTSPTLAEYKPLTTSQKFKIARQDTFDRGTVALAAAFAGESQLSNSNPSFGQGVEGYAHYFGTAYADFAVGNYLTEGVYPTILHQDPRYFRRGKGRFVSRLAYSASQIFLTHGDSGQTEFNFSELAGNSTAVAISMAYYPENRDVGDAVSKLGSQLGVDMASNILKEFAPDIARKFSRKHRNPSAQ